MASIRSTPKSLQGDVLKILNAYTEEVVDAVKQEISDTAETGAELLRNIRQPEASETGTARPMKRRQWRKYSKSWKVKYDGNNEFYRATIHNQRHYRLTHLLEYGHLTRNGTMTRAFRHIEPVEIMTTERVVKNIPKIIEKGGKL